MNAPRVTSVDDHHDDQDYLEIDRAQPSLGAVEVLGRHLDGRYPVDKFGADPQLQDLCAPLLDFAVRVRVVGAEHLEGLGAAALVCNRGFGFAEAAVASVGVRDAVGRRLRVVGAPDIPLIDTAARKLGVIGATSHEVRSCLRSGHLVAIPSSRTWFRSGAGTPPRWLLFGALGFPVLPCALKPLGPFGIPWSGWEMRIGPLVHLEAGDHPVGDPLAAAELGSSLTVALEALLD